MRAVLIVTTPQGLQVQAIFKVFFNIHYRWHFTLSPHIIWSEFQGNQVDSCEFKGYQPRTAKKDYSRISSNLGWILVHCKRIITDI